MRTVPGRVLLGSMLLAVLLPAAVAGAATPEQVQASLQKAKDYLYSKQKNGNWEVTPAPAGNRRQHAKLDADQWGGLTAIATYALLASGESSQDPRIKEAIGFLLKADIIGTYALGMRAQVWNLIPQPPKEIKDAAKRDRQMLMDLLIKTPPDGKNDEEKRERDRRGLYNYHNLGEDRMDMSCSNYGVLGMWACTQLLRETPRAYWEEVDKAWGRRQLANGAWEYDRMEGDGRYSMTTAGIATLYICMDYLNEGRSPECKGNIRDPRIDRAMEWINKNFTKYKDGDWGFYSLYNTERVGVASGMKYFGNINWFEDGVEFLLKEQDRKTGGWGGHEIADTCFGILFLVRGRAPIVMNKLMYDIDRGGDKPLPANWNERPRDCANFVHWFMKESDGKPLNWQIVNLSVDVGELHDSPILYIAGNQALNFKAEEVAKLRQFVEAGGLILGHADCGSDQFNRSYKALAKKLFPLYEFRELPATHPVYTLQQYPRANWRNPPSVLGLSNGARELMVLIPLADPGRYWQMGSYLDKKELHEVVANLFLYTVTRQNLRFKGETFIVKKDNAPAKNTVKVARLQYDDGIWDPEPAGWGRLSNIMHNQLATDVETETVKLGAGKLGGFKVAHLTGTGHVKLSPAAQAEIRQFVATGGTLIVEACGGSTEFAADAEREVAAIFPSAKMPLPTLALDHPALTAGGKIASVDYRKYAVKVLGRLGAPRIRGYFVNPALAAATAPASRLTTGPASGPSAGGGAVFLSSEDLSTGLVGNPVDGITGYEPKTASAIMSSLVLYGAGLRITDEEIAALASGIRRTADANGPDMAKALRSLAGKWWSISNCKMDQGEIGLHDFRGKEKVLITHPLDAKTACVISRKLDIPAGKTTTLKLTVGHFEKFEWDLVVKVDGKEKLKKLVADSTDKDGWLDVEVDLSEYAGTKIQLDLLNQPNGRAMGHAAWARIEIQSK